MNSKVNILVACHKPGPVFHNAVYQPIHVGRSISRFKDEMKDMIGDDQGDNISVKNSNYCELTAQYWAWKNLTNCEYIGLCHYRRFFRMEITEDNIDKLLGRHYDVMLVKPWVELDNLFNRLSKTVCLEDALLFVYSLKKCYPDYYQDAVKLLQGNRITPFNMFIMKRDEFVKFAKWEFDILFEMEKHCKLGSYSRQRRVFGYVSEMLLELYCRHNKLRVRYEAFSDKIGGEELHHDSSLHIWIRTLLFKMTHRCPLNVFAEKAVLLGLEQDGIVLDKSVITE